MSVSTHMQSLKKIGQKLLKLESGNKQNVIFNLNQGPFDEIYPSTISNHSLPILTYMQSLKKIGQKVLKLESRNEQNAIFNLNQGP